MRHECYTNDMRSTRVENFDFDNDTSKNIFLHPYIYPMASERLQGEQQFHSRNYLLEMSFRCKNTFKKCTTKTKLFNGKSYIKTLYTRLQLQANALGRFHIVTHKITASFSIKTILCENNNTLFSKNY